MCTHVKLEETRGRIDLISLPLHHTIGLFLPPSLQLCGHSRASSCPLPLPCQVQSAALSLGSVPLPMPRQLLLVQVCTTALPASLPAHLAISQGQLSLLCVSTVLTALPTLADSGLISHHWGFPSEDYCAIEGTPSCCHDQVLLIGSGQRLGCCLKI